LETVPHTKEGAISGHMKDNFCHQQFIVASYTRLHVLPQRLMFCQCQTVKLPDCREGIADLILATTTFILWSHLQSCCCS